LVEISAQPTRTNFRPTWPN